MQLQTNKKIGVLDLRRHLFKRAGNSSLLEQSNKRKTGVQLHEGNVLEIAEEIEQNGPISVFLKYGGRKVISHDSIFEAAANLHPDLLKTPTISPDTQKLINKYSNVSSIDELQIFFNEYRVAPYIKDYLLEYISQNPNISTKMMSKIARVVLLWYEGFKPVQSKRPDAAMREDIEIQALKVLLHEPEAKPVQFWYYYALYKSGNPLKTGSNHESDLADLELFYSQLPPVILGETLQIPMQWVIINEATETRLLDGVPEAVVNKNQQLLQRYFKLLNVSGNFTFRSMRRDIREHLGLYFDTLFKKSLEEIQVKVHHVKNFALFPQMKYYYNKSLSKQDIKSILLATVTEDFSFISPRVFTIAQQNASVFLALQKTRELAFQYEVFSKKNTPPEYRKDTFQAMVIRNPNKFSIKSLSDFAGKAKLPNYGIPVYSNHMYLGELHFWEILSHIDLFAAHVVGEKIVAVELYQNS